MIKYLNHILILSLLIVSNIDAQMIHRYGTTTGNFLEIGVFQGVTARNICELLYKINKDNFKYVGIDIFEHDEKSKNEIIPNIDFKNPLKQFFYKYIKRENPYSLISVKKLLKRFEKNVEIIKGDSKEILPSLDLTEVDYVFLDGGHSYETVKSDLNNCKIVIKF